MHILQHIQAVLLLSLLSISNAFAQEYAPWVIIDPPQHLYPIADGRLIYSANLNKVLFNYRFERNDGSRYLAGFDGNEWTVVYEPFNGGPGGTIIDYNDGILFGFNTLVIDDTLRYGSALLQNGSWSYPWHFNGRVIRFRMLNGHLTAIGNFTEIDGQPVSHVARLVDGVWEQLVDLTPYGIGFIFQDIAWYQGHYYVGGRFSVGGILDLFMIVDGTPQPVGPGLAGPYHTVHNFIVYQDELYITGAIGYHTGNVGNHIIRWDGDSLRPVGDLFMNTSGGTNMSRIRDGVWESDGYLWVCGGFQIIGGQEIACMARWDGNQWCGLHGSEAFAPYPWAAAEIDGKILMHIPIHINPGLGGNIWMYEDKNNIANCTEPLVSVAERLAPDKISLYPNPTSGQVWVENPTGQVWQAQVYDMAGRMVHNNLALPPGSTPLLLPTTAGLYLLRAVSAAGEVVTIKVVKE
jgi:hypothetical protein